MQEWPGLVDGQVEPLDQDARGVKRPIVAPLAGHRRRDLGQVSPRPLEPLIAGSVRGRRGCFAGRPRRGEGGAGTADAGAVPTPGPAAAVRLRLSV